MLPVLAGTPLMLFCAADVCIAWLAAARNAVEPSGRHRAGHPSEHALEHRPSARACRAIARVMQYRRPSTKCIAFGVPPAARERPAPGGSTSSRQLRGAWHARVTPKAPLRECEGLQRAGEHPAVPLSTGCAGGVAGGATIADAPQLETQRCAGAPCLAQPYSIGAQRSRVDSPTPTARNECVQHRSEQCSDHCCSLT